jgi:hypothetical protein
MAAGKSNAKSAVLMRALNSTIRNILRKRYTLRTLEFSAINAIEIQAGNSVNFQQFLAEASGIA